MFVSTSWGPKYVYAIDAKPGERKWTYEPEIPDDVLQYACCDVNSRGTEYGKLTNLYTSSTVAFDADTGKIKWWVQSTPEDAWDYDGVNDLVLADIPVGGAKTPVYMKADRNGFFYVVNRGTGKIVSAEKYVPTTWADRIDIATGKPREAADQRPGPNHPVKGVCPNLIGGKNWQPMSYSPDTGLVYIPTNNVCMDWSVVGGELSQGRVLPRRRVPDACRPGRLPG